MTMTREPYFSALEVPVTVLPSTPFGELPVLHQSVLLRGADGRLLREPQGVCVPATAADITDEVLALLQARLVGLGLRVERIAQADPP